MAEKIVFSAQAPCTIKADELEAMLKGVELDQSARTVMTSLLVGGYGNGVIVRQRFDDDAPTHGRIIRMGYESYVRDAVDALPEAVRPVALNLALFSYSEGHRCQEGIPEYFRALETAIGNEEAESIFDLAQR